MGGEAHADGAEDAQGANQILAWVESHRVWFLCVFFGVGLSAATDAIPRAECSSGYCTCVGAV
jgi:hypothetical protein